MVSGGAIGGIGARGVGESDIGGAGAARIGWNGAALL
jgi:hypothetical protein